MKGDKISPIAMSEIKQARYRVGKESFFKKEEAEHKARTLGFRNRKTFGHYFVKVGKKWMKKNTPTILNSYFEERVLPNIVRKLEDRHPGINRADIITKFSLGNIEYSKFTREVGYSRSEVNWLRNRILEYRATDASRLFDGEKYELIPGRGLQKATP